MQDSARRHTFAIDWYKEKDIIVDLPNKQGKSRETIRFADEVAFIVLKALAFDSRNTNKDAGDLVYVLKNGTPDVIAETYSQRLLAGQHVQALEDGLKALVKRFCDDEKIDGYEKDGPSKYAIFMGLANASDDERARVMRDASGLVTYFVKEVEKHTNRTFLPAPAQPQADAAAV
ncbi:hypothetical protein [Duganella sp. BuS-21]|uniref:hypothetical protein n=1 Tax=Duganella sp. BuS-21 TaxID=2943848 RepID=UPI0035A65FF5